MLKSISCVALLALMSASSFAMSSAAGPAKGDLFKTIESLDAKLFGAYNDCDMDTFGPLVESDIEFYHDMGGVSRGRQSLLDALEKNICNKVHRQLVPGTLQVYPIGDRSALEMGDHLFCKPPTEECDGFAKFAHVWVQRDGAWQITRIFSYDHGAADNAKLKAADGSATPELRAEVIEADRVLTAAFDHCDGVAYAESFSADAELYNDQGLIRSSARIGEWLDTNCHEGVRERQVIVAGATQVYPMNDYGAIQFKDAHIYKRGAGKRGKALDQVRQILLWQRTAGIWKITRAVSYRP